jgi:hypothetical protein
LRAWAESKRIGADVAAEVARDVYSEVTRRVMEDGIVTPDERAKLDALAAALELDRSWTAAAEKDALDGVFRVRMGNILAPESATHVPTKRDVDASLDGLDVGSRPRPKTRAPKRVGHFDEVVKGTFVAERQRAVNRCKIHERVALRHEPQNPKDRDAIAVTRLNGDHLGYLAKGIGGPMLRKAAQGYLYSGFIKKFLEPDERHSNRGVVLWIIEAKPGVSDEEAQDYVDDLLRRNRV